MSILGDIILLFKKPKPQSKKKPSHGMRIAVKMSNPKEGFIMHENLPLVNCIVEGNIVTVRDNCPHCGSNEVEHYKCKYCKAELKYDNYFNRL